MAEQYLKKGSTVYIEGQLQTRKYTDKDGVEKYSTEVVLQNYRGELTMLGGRGWRARARAASAAATISASRARWNGRAAGRQSRRASPVTSTTKFRSKTSDLKVFSRALPGPFFSPENAACFHCIRKAPEPSLGSLPNRPVSGVARQACPQCSCRFSVADNDDKKGGLHARQSIRDFSHLHRRGDAQELSRLRHERDREPRASRCARRVEAGAPAHPLSR